MRKTEIRMISCEDECLVFFLDENACAHGVDESTPLTGFRLKNHGGKLDQIVIQLLDGKPVCIQTIEE